MRDPEPAGAAVPPWTLAIGAMLSVQLGSALSVPLIATAGAAGVAWLRLSFGALAFLVLARPPLRSVRRRDLPALLGLGVTSGAERDPLDGGEEADGDEPVWVRTMKAA